MKLQPQASFIEIFLDFSINICSSFLEILFFHIISLFFLFLRFFDYYSSE